MAMSFQSIESFIRTAASCLAFGGFWLVVISGAAAARRSTSTRDQAQQELRRRRRKEEGRWLGATKPEIDKSTTGRLLAGRIRRDPSLIDHVSLSPSPPGPDPAPPRHDGLWDREIDG